MVKNFWQFWRTIGWGFWEPRKCNCCHRWMPTRANKRFISIYLVQTVSLISSATIPNRYWPQWRKASFSAVLAGAQPEIGQPHLFVWEFGTCSRSASMESALAELAFDGTNQELDDDNEFLNDKGTRTGTKHLALITLSRWGGPIWVWFCKHRWRSEPRRNRCWRQSCSWWREVCSEGMLLLHIMWQNFAHGMLGGTSTTREADCHRTW